MAKKPLVTYAFEGINAGGKSTVIKEISSWYFGRGYSPQVDKIGGLGDFAGIDNLKKILEHRERLRRDSKLTYKQEQDFLRDRIFRLAIRKQIRNYERKEFDTNTISLLDRTPLMSWAYAFSVNPNNPYLNEILEEGLELTSKLAIDTIFLLDIDPINVYSRIICRSLEESEPIEKQISDFSNLIFATEEIKQAIVQRSLEYLASGISFQKKNFRIWDFMTYEEIDRQSGTYFEAIKIAEEVVGIKVIRIDARKQLEQVIESIKVNIL